MNNFKEEINVEKKLNFFQRLKKRLYKIKENILLFTKKLFSKEKPKELEELFLETAIVVDMAKIEYVDLEKLLSIYDEKSKLFLIGKGFNKFDQERVSKLPYTIDYVKVAKKVSTGKQLKIVLKALRKENKYQVITIKGRGSHLVETYFPIKKEKTTKKPLKKSLAKEERWIPFKGLFQSSISYPSLEEIKKQKNLSTVCNHLILWDIENISYKNIAKIVSKLGEVNTFYCISVAPLGEKATKKLFVYTLAYNMRIKVGHHNSDDEIVRIIENEYKKYKTITIISSDTDFVPIIKKLLKDERKVQIIGIDSQKKGIFMQNNIGDSNLKIITI